MGGAETGRPPRSRGEPSPLPLQPCSDDGLLLCLGLYLCSIVCITLLRGFSGVSILLICFTTQ